MRQELSILFISLEAKNPPRTEKRKTQDTIAEGETEIIAAGLCVFSPIFQLPDYPNFLPVVTTLLSSFLFVRFTSQENSEISLVLPFVP